VIALPPEWRDRAIEQARLGPRQARAFAAVLEMTFTQPWEAELRAEAETLARWLRATAAR
jgi:hypothetical protein